MASKPRAHTVTIIEAAPKFTFHEPTKSVRWCVVFDDHIEHRTMPISAFEESHEAAKRILAKHGDGRKVVPLRRH